MGWSEWSNGKKGGVIGGAIFATLLIVGAGVGIGVSAKNKKIEMWVPWDVSPQLTALEEITELYNETHDNKYKIVVKTAGEGGYKESGFTTTNELIKNNLNHTKKLPEIVINNQDMLSILANESKDLIVNLAEEGLEVENLAIQTQEKVANVTDGNTDASEYYGLRFYSTQNMAIDIPLMLWLEDNGVISVAAGELRDAMDKVEKLDNEDKKTIESIWAVEGTPTPFAMDDTTLESQEGIDEFAAAVLEGTEYVGKPAPGSRGVVAYTNPQTEFMTALQSYSGGVTSTDMVNVTDKGNEYLFLTDSDEYGLAGDVWESFATGVEQGYYWLGGGEIGVYSSAKVSGHISPISIGSTSGTSYNVSGDEALLNSDEIYYTNSYSSYKKDGAKVYKSQGPSMMLINKGDKRSEEKIDVSIDFMNWLIAPEKNVAIEDGNIVEGTEMTAGTAFSIVSDFLLNSNEALKYVEDAGFSDANEPGLFLMQKTLADADKSANLFSEPNDANTAEFWGIIKNEMKDQESKLATGKTDDFETWEAASVNIIEQVNQKGLDVRPDITLPKRS